MPLYAIVDQETCMACGACNSIAPEIFEIEDDGTAFVTIGNNKGSEPIPDEFIDDVEDAAEDCPSESIVIQHKVFENVAE